MKKLLFMILICIIIVSSISCQNEKIYNIDPNESQMKSICELATLEYHFHNVAVYDKKDVKEILFWSWDKTFWIEYSGVIKAGIKANNLKINIRKNKIKIKLPKKYRVKPLFGESLNESETDEISLYMKKHHTAVFELFFHS